MTEDQIIINEDCCWNYFRDMCSGKECKCTCHEPILKPKSESNFIGVNCKRCDKIFKQDTRDFIFWAYCIDCMYKILDERKKQSS